MNNTFNSQRFLLLFKKQTAEHLKAYLLSTAVLLGTLLLLLAYVTFTENGRLTANTQTGIFIWILVLSGSIFTSLCFSSLSSKQAILTLTLPASHFEKFLVQWVYSFVIFQIVFLGVFFLADGIVFSLFPTGTGYDGTIVRNKVIGLLDSGNRNALMGMGFYTLFHALSLFGAVFFEKLHFIKSASIFLLGLLLLMIINQPFLNYICGRTFSHSSLPFASASFTDRDFHNISVRIDVSDNTITMVLTAFAVVVVLLWTGAFFKLKEKQV